MHRILVVVLLLSATQVVGLAERIDSISEISEDELAQDFDALFSGKSSTTPSFAHDWTNRTTSQSMSMGFSVDRSADGKSLFVCGKYSGTLVSGLHSIQSAGGEDGFIASLNAHDGAVNWLVGLGGTGDDRCWDLVALPSGDVAAVGLFSSSMTIGSSGTHDSAGGTDIWAGVLDQNGQWQWSQRAGGDGDDVAAGVATDSVGSLFVSGWYSSSNAAFGNFTLDSGGSERGFVAKISSSSTWSWLAHTYTQSGDGVSDHRFWDIATGTAGDVFVGGYFTNQIRFSGSSILQTSSGLRDGIIARLNASGDWTWARKVGGSSADSVWAIDTDINGDLAITGSFTGSISLGSQSLQSNGGSDIFLAGLAQNSSWIWSVGAGGSGNDAGWGVDIDKQNGTVHLIGGTQGNPVFGNATVVGLGDEDGIIASYSQSSGWTFVITYGGQFSDRGYDLVSMGDSDLALTGRMKGTGAILDATSTGGSDHDFHVTRIGLDHDEDDVPTRRDNCPNLSNPNQADRDMDGNGDICDSDMDGDGIENEGDTCPLGETNWNSNSASDHDGDGCRDATEDSDDDSDGVPDVQDNCRTGKLGWTSSPADDRDLDGCHDLDEDDDDDGDGVDDSIDLCPTGVMNWQSNFLTTDNDEDGCHDDLEDSNDDNDPYLDAEDDCPRGYVGWTANNSNDHDNDGCYDHTEDNDDDNDGVMDANDRCPLGVEFSSWIDALDHDGDGCHDDMEDSNDDADPYPDDQDDCPRGVVGWIGNSLTDHDQDGCLDSADEDDDDDNDGIPDGRDGCPVGELDWTSDSTTDHDDDGCKDDGEDSDDDGDGIDDDDDNCQLGITGWTSNSTSDFDGDGCQDVNEDHDDDNDGIVDDLDNCPRGKLGWISTEEIDWDRDGCHDEDEDSDVDGDNYEDSIDAFPRDPEHHLDSDGDGIPDGEETWIMKHIHEGHRPIVLLLLALICVIPLGGGILVSRKGQQNMEDDGKEYLNSADIHQGLI